MSSNSKRLRAEQHSNQEWTAKDRSTISRSLKSVHNKRDSKSCNCCYKLPMLHPMGPFRCSWDVIIMLMLIYTSLEVPFTIGFGIDLALSGKYYEFGIIALLIDIFLLTDICLNFRTAFFDKYDDLRLITNQRRIAWRYIKGWFVIDLITSFPFEFILPSNGEAEHYQHGNKFTTYLKMLRIFRLFRIVKILRLLKMVKLFDGFVSHIIAREVIMAVKMFKILCFSILTGHFCACLWYYVGCKSHSVYDVSWITTQGMVSADCGIDLDGAEDSTLFVKYTLSWYWSVVTLFTTGYGDIIPTNPYEQWTASAVILIGTCLFGYFIGTITSLIFEGDRVRATIVSKLEDAQHFCQQKRLPPKMARAVLTHTRYSCNNNYVLGDENDVLSNLPSYLAMDVSLYISDKYLEHLDFLSNKFIDPYVRGLIAMKMKSISCNKGFKLFVKGDIAEKIYIQRVGTAQQIIYDKNNGNNRYRKKMKRGDVVGEYALILKKRDSTLICKTWCEFYEFDVNDILEILQQHYGQNWIKKLKKIKKFIKTEYSKPIRHRKKRHCLIKNNPLLPSFRGEGDDNKDNKYNNNDEKEEEGEEGHCDWGNQEEIKEAKNLHHLEALTDEVLAANAKEDIKIGLNALSKHAFEITKLTNDSNKSFIQNRMSNPLSSASTATMRKSMTVIKRGLMREDSFIRDLEVAKSYNNIIHHSSDSDDEYNDDTKYDDNLQEYFEEIQKAKDIEDNKDNDTEFVKRKKGKTNTLDVANDIIEMMETQIIININDADDDRGKTDKNNNNNNDDRVLSIESNQDEKVKNNNNNNNDNDNNDDGNIDNNKDEGNNDLIESDEDQDDDESNNTDSVTMSDSYNESRNTDTFSETDNFNHKQKKQKKRKGKGNQKKKKKKKKRKNQKVQSFN